MTEIIVDDFPPGFILRVRVISVDREAPVPHALNLNPTDITELFVNHKNMIELSH